MDGVYNSKHGDDMKLVLYCTHGWALKKHVMIRATFPYCTHGADMMFVFFIASMDGLYKRGGG